MKFSTFVEPSTELSLSLPLLDLARALSKDPTLEVGFSFHGYFSYLENKLYLSTFWERYSNEERTYGLKTEVYMRAFAQYHFSDNRVIQQIIKKSKSLRYPNIYRHIAYMMELRRYQQICQKLRPGMKKALTIREQVLVRYSLDRIRYFLSQKKVTDAYFFFLTLPDQEKETGIVSKEVPEWFGRVPLQPENEPNIERAADQLYHSIHDQLTEDLSSMYLWFEEQKIDTFDDLKRPSSVDMDDKERLDAKQEQPVEEKLPTWHRETETPNQSFLQFEVEQGTSSNLLGNQARDSDAGDQANAVVQGASVQTKRNSFDPSELASKVQKRDAVYPYGESNRYARLLDAPTDKVTPDMEQAYERMRKEILPYKKRLIQSIEKTLEAKRIEPRTELHAGRLGKALLRIKTEQNPRLFYKKNNKSKKKNAVITLLVDCSSSMLDKMEQTYKGLILFHEVLQHNAITHEIAGFWEDGLRAKKDDHPNYLKKVIPFEKSLVSGSGVHITTLQAEEDNRDGYIIRKTVETLEKRSEKQKILFVFTDGVPAAMDYQENGVLDTHQAVIEARRKGILVIGVFLSNEEVTERDREIMLNIYGSASLVLSNLNELPNRLVPLLKKLLFQFL